MIVSPEPRLRGSSQRVTSVVLSVVLAMVGTSGSVAAAKCTYTFPPGGGSYPLGTVTRGDVLCGGRGADKVETMAGGRFLGGGGGDQVGAMTGGRFEARWGSARWLF